MAHDYVLGEHFEQFIKAQLDSGRYDSPDQIMRDALQLLEEREQLHQIRQERLRNEIAKGVNSGPGIPAEQVFAELKARYQKMAKDQAERSGA